MSSNLEFMPISRFEKRGRNLYKLDSTYFKLFGLYVGQANYSPYMRELSDIDIATGIDIFGIWQQKLDISEENPLKNRDFIAVYS